MNYPLAKRILVTHPALPTLQLLQELERRMVNGSTFQGITYQELSDAIAFLDQHVNGVTL